ncbi:MAG: sulfotransferase family protein [Asgard group archaeon]|nr:sulfotransferase family protein [Asgard group archaeon]
MNDKTKRRNNLQQQFKISSLRKKIRETKFYQLYIRKPFSENNINVDHARKLIFVHIPKTAGTSVKKALNLSIETASHEPPTLLVHKKTWENYFSFTIVRHPVERLLSSYYYHTNKNYTGSYYRKFPDLHNFTFQDYFRVFSQLNAHALIPQINFIKHKYSNKPIDIICKFSNLIEDLKPILDKLHINLDIPHLNKGVYKKANKIEIDQDTLEKIHEFYKEDYITFGFEKRNVL